MDTNLEYNLVFLNHLDFEDNLKNNFKVINFQIPIELNFWRILSENTLFSNNKLKINSQTNIKKIDKNKDLDLLIYIKDLKNHMNNFKIIYKLKEKELKNSKNNETDIIIQTNGNIFLTDCIIFKGNIKLITVGVYCKNYFRDKNIIIKSWEEKFVKYKWNFLNNEHEKLIEIINEKRIAYKEKNNDFILNLKFLFKSDISYNYYSIKYQLNNLEDLYFKIFNYTNFFNKSYLLNNDLLIYLEKSFIEKFDSFKNLKLYKLFNDLIHILKIFLLTSNNKEKILKKISEFLEFYLKEFFKDIHCYKFFFSKQYLLKLFDLIRISLISEYFLDIMENIYLDPKIFNKKKITIFKKNNRKRSYDKKCEKIKSKLNNVLDFIFYSITKIDFLNNNDLIIFNTNFIEIYLKWKKLNDNCNKILNNLKINNKIFNSKEIKINLKDIKNILKNLYNIDQNFLNQLGIISLFDKFNFFKNLNFLKLLKINVSLINDIIKIFIKNKILCLDLTDNINIKRIYNFIDKLIIILINKNNEFNDIKIMDILIKIILNLRKNKFTYLEKIIIINLFKFNRLNYLLYNYLEKVNFDDINKLFIDLFIILNTKFGYFFDKYFYFIDSNDPNYNNLIKLEEDRNNNFKKILKEKLEINYQIEIKKNLGLKIENFIFDFNNFNIKEINIFIELFYNNDKTLIKKVIMFIQKNQSSKDNNYIIENNEIISQIFLGICFYFQNIRNIYFEKKILKNDINIINEWNKDLDLVLELSILFFYKKIKNSFNYLIDDNNYIYNNSNILRYLLSIEDLLQTNIKIKVKKIINYLSIIGDYDLIFNILINNLFININTFSIECFYNYVINFFKYNNNLDFFIENFNENDIKIKINNNKIYKLFNDNIFKYDFNVLQNIIRLIYFQIKLNDFTLFNILLEKRNLQINNTIIKVINNFEINEFNLKIWINLLKDPFFKSLSLSKKIISYFLNNLKKINSKLYIYYLDILAIFLDEKIGIRFYCSKNSSYLNLLEDVPLESETKKIINLIIDKEIENKLLMINDYFKEFINLIKKMISNKISLDLFLYDDIISENFKKEPNNRIERLFCLFKNKYNLIKNDNNFLIKLLLNIKKSIFKHYKNDFKKIFPNYDLYFNYFNNDKNKLDHYQKRNNKLNNIEKIIINFDEMIPESIEERYKKFKNKELKNNIIDSLEKQLNFCTKKNGNKFKFYLIKWNIINNFTFYFDSKNLFKKINCENIINFNKNEYEKKNFKINKKILNWYNIYFIKSEHKYEKIYEEIQNNNLKNNINHQIIYNKKNNYLYYEVPNIENFFGYYQNIYFNNNNPYINLNHNYVNIQNINKINYPVVNLNNNQNNNFKFNQYYNPNYDSYTNKLNENNSDETNNNLNINENFKINLERNKNNFNNDYNHNKIPSDNNRNLNKNENINNVNNNYNANIIQNNSNIQKDKLNNQQYYIINNKKNLNNIKNQNNMNKRY